MPRLSRLYPTHEEGATKMDMTVLPEYSRQIQAMIGNVTGREVDRAVEELVTAAQWDLLDRLLATASELAARRIVNQMLTHQRYDPLAWGACLRRQPRAPSLEAGGGGMARRVFRDFEAEDATEAIPEHILAEARDITQAADQRRGAAQQRAAELDRDPIRNLIVTELANRLPESAAGAGLLIIAQACPFEQTRREAAMRLANNRLWIKQLAAQKRAGDLIHISEVAGLGAVASTIAQLLGPQLSDLRETGDRETLDFIAEHHPAAEIRSAARQPLA